MKEKLSPKDIQTLSTYLDGKLGPWEKARLESRLKQQGDLQEELEALRQTRLMLQKLPRRRAPRNFTLSPATAPQRPVQPLFPAFRFATALTGVLLMATFAAQFLFGSMAAASQATAPMALSAASSKALGTAPASEAPIILWGTPTTAPGAPGTYGYGGGPGGGSSALPGVTNQQAASNLAAEETATGTPAQSGQSLAAVGPAETPTPPPESGKPLAALRPTGSETPAATTAPASALPAAPAASDHQNSTGPILGIRPPNPTEAPGQAPAPERSAASPAASMWTWGETSLIIILVGMAAAAFYFYRRERL